MKRHSLEEKVKKIELPTPYSLFDVGTIMCNAYLIVDSCLTLIDTSAKSKKALGVLTDYFSKLGFNLEDLDRIIVTHGHSDHYGLAKELQRISRSKIYVHEADGYKLKRRNQYDNKEMLQLLFQSGVPIDQIAEMKKLWKSDEKYFDPIDDFIPIDESHEFLFDDFVLKVIHSKGHTSGHICLYEPQDKLFFSGDHLLRDVTPNPFIEFLEKEGPRTPSLKIYLNTLQETIKLPISKTFPAHGENISDHKQVILKLFEHHQKRKEKIYSVIEKNPFCTVYNISETIFPNSRLYNLMLGISEVLGHMDLLLDEEKIRFKISKGINYYRRT